MRRRQFDVGAHYLIAQTTDMAQTETQDFHRGPNASGPMPEHSVLIADDQDDVRAALRMLLKSCGYRVHEAQSPEEVVAVLADEEFSAVLLDMNYRRDTTSGAEGLDLIGTARSLVPEVPIIVLTAWASIELAVEAMQRGASDFIEKPWDNPRLLQVLETQIALAASHRNERRLSAANRLLLDDIGGDFIAESPQMQRVMHELAQIASSDANVLLLGENGTGKSVLAQRIHNWSPRRGEPFVKVDLGGISPGLFEAELFGHVKGAYTDAKSGRAGRFEVADGGTLFLDEIGNLLPEQQPKLLRAIEDGEFERVGSSHTQRVSVRIVSATNCSLATEIKSGRFRQDLYYRINTFQVTIPPLRDRTSDIVPLARHYLDSLSMRYRGKRVSLTPAAERALQAYAWPGNVRELAHVMERSVLLADNERLSPDDLRLLHHSHSDDSSLDGLTLEQAEIWLLRRAMQRCRGNLQQAAEALDITRQSLYRRLQKHGLSIDALDSGW